MRNGNLFSLLATPLLVIIIAYFAIPQAGQLSAGIKEQLALAPYLVLFAALSLGTLYKRHRIILLSVTLGLGYWIIHSAFAATGHVGQSERLLLTATNLVLTFGIIGIVLINERRLLGIQTFITMSLFVGLALATAWLMRSYPSEMASLLMANLFATPLDGSVRGDPVLIAQCIAIIAMLVILSKRRTVFEAGYLGTLVALALAQFTEPGTPQTSLYITLAGLLPVIALVQNSYFIAYIDELTELPGRRALNEDLSRVRGKYVIAMLDVDHFKKFNDTYGHDIGDQVLRMVASKIRDVGGGGRPFRYGGEEFSILFPGKNMRETFPHLSRLREAIDDTRMILRSKNRPEKRPEQIRPPKKPWQEVHVTISIGMAESNDQLQTTDEVIKGADEALYKAKEKGRNRISQYGLNGEPPRDSMD